VARADASARAGDVGGDDAGRRHSIRRAAEGAVAIASRRIDVSSTEIRGRVAAGRSLRGFVPDSVAAYIAAHGLYR